MAVRAHMSSIGRMRMLAGDPALDFANTLHWREGRQVDFVPDYCSLVEWSVPAGLVKAAERDLLLALAAADPDQAAATHQQALAMRELWREHLSARVGHERAGSSDCLPASLAEMLPELLAILPLMLNLGVKSNEMGLRLPLTRLALAIASLQTIPVERQISQCEGDPCGGFFLNTSRSKPRRWCSMDACGNRAKVKQFRSRFVAERTG